MPAARVAMPTVFGFLRSSGDCSLHSSLNCHAYKGADSVCDRVLAFEGVVVGTDFSDFMDGADGSDENRDVRHRPLRPTKAEGEGDQSEDSEVHHPVHSTRKGVAGIGCAANDKKAERKQHGECAGKPND